MICGPGWINSDCYDVLAKAGGAPALARERVRALLTGRFGLGGCRPATRHLSWRSRPAQRYAATIEMLARELAGMTGRAVIGKTSLTGKYDWTLEWSPDADDTSRPSLFTAVQEQLGVKLRTAKRPVDVVVIDHVDRPSQN